MNRISEKDSIIISCDNFPTMYDSCFTSLKDAIKSYQYRHQRNFNNSNRIYQVTNRDKNWSAFYKLINDRIIKI